MSQSTEKDAGMTPDEARDVRAAFERDKWAGEWNSLPTAIDRLLAARVIPPVKMEGDR
jgi:hypothetical protein